MAAAAFRMLNSPLLTQSIAQASSPSIQVKLNYTQETMTKYSKSKGWQGRIKSFFKVEFTCAQQQATAHDVITA